MFVLKGQKKKHQTNKQKTKNKKQQNKTKQNKTKQNKTKTNRQKTKKNKNKFPKGIFQWRWNINIAEIKIRFFSGRILGAKHFFPHPHGLCSLVRKRRG